MVDANTIAILLDGFVSPTSLWFDGNSGVLSVNTQARRFGCLVYLLGLVSQGRKVESMLLSLPSQEVLALKRNLAANGFTSGYLTTKTSSVQHYLDTAVGFHLLVRQGSVFSLTGRGRFFLDTIRPDLKAPYPLTPQTKVFFLHTLLRVDFFGTAAIVRSLLHGARKLSEMQRSHQSYLLRLLEDVARCSANTRFRRLVQDRIISVRDWKKPESYAEHLVSAKLNWLTDLGILEAAPSPTSSISIRSEYREWLNDFGAITTPSELLLTSIVLHYAEKVVSKCQPSPDNELCLALRSAFCRLASPGTLRKIRSSDLVLFLLCFHAPMLIAYIGERKALFTNETINCGDVTYKAHVASRPTQSFIISERKVTKSWHHQ